MDEPAEETKAETLPVTDTKEELVEHKNESDSTATSKEEISVTANAGGEPDSAATAKEETTVSEASEPPVSTSKETVNFTASGAATITETSKDEAIATETPTVSSKEELVVKVATAVPHKSEESIQTREKEENVINLEKPSERILEKIDEVFEELTAVMIFDESLTACSESSAGATPATPPPSPALNAEPIKWLDSELTRGFLARLQEVVGEQPGKVSKSGMELLQSPSQKETGISKKGPIKKAGFARASDVYVDTEFDALREQELLIEKELEKQQLQECRRYTSVDIFASGFVRDIIKTSVSTIKDHEQKPADGEYSQCGEETTVSMRTYTDVFGTFMRWPRIQEFSKEMGFNIIADFLLTWDYMEDWLYCTDFLLEQSDDCSDYYLYEAKWSIPSKPYPIPQATASVFFTFEVSRVKPPYCPVDVTYVFEGSRFVHIPGKIQFQEKWLFDIIDAKITLFKQLRF